ncbi:MAG: tRNA uridine-5-carboxymethylaminomethyl(34) synthesis enzyme MnmG [Candidatus Aureabacteria bacterium]|nr:tRNA uridine-5-carboxymethylaminomethyl(34) synthesis enzyme MnmG [Candidatus Auribacterota bacterium]
MGKTLKYNVIVIGGGHAGCEAANIVAQMGKTVALLTMSLKNIAKMSCNPAIGGLAKGHLVREIDSLGGVMGIVTDKSAIHYKMLNRKKGPSVWSPRAQIDKQKYSEIMEKMLSDNKRITLTEDIAGELIIKQGSAKGVKTLKGDTYLADAVIVATGTFLNGMIHIGYKSFPGGRAGEEASTGLSLSLKSSGLELGRLKTGTPPRVRKDTIDYSRCVIEPSESPQSFSFRVPFVTYSTIDCYITKTTAETKKILTENVKKTAMYSGKITGRGVRYCPSIEDKFIKFPDKESHQVFIEPEGLNTDEVYLNGISTSLPENLQLDMVHSIPGLEKAVIIRPAYAIEYDFVYPTQLYASLETKKIRNLFLAGQINGTSGYEEAAAQGLIAGVNAVLNIDNKAPFILKRSDAYIGVLIDDLVTKGTAEPYRMFTSRAEYRLVLRQDNADLRLMEYGYRIGTITDEEISLLRKKRESIEKEKTRIKRNKKLLADIKSGKGYFETLQEAKQEAPHNIAEHVLSQVIIDLKYEGYIEKQLKQIEMMRRMEDFKIPADFNYRKITALKKESIEKLSAVMPMTLGQASRISGVSPADISIIMIHLRKEGAAERQHG